ncbi:NAD(P)-dependent oxidoreductase [Rhizobium multihospitium]|uniref:NAD(P)-binding domain-containing protein n=1 Tax=Rhizobium multihospitium TaxID=410764 RepID=A0A1C3X5D3_9HYPH|nr:NAD(P)-dependent oxidoreductase [Rhizobium multihospitium]SCB47480.1 hypothetical protein GA0061103_0171 [Rhizobium multihospitium]
MSKVALIGASGRAGSRILRELVARGHHVTAIARNPEAIAEIDGVAKVAGDIVDEDALATILAGHDAVISAVKFVASDPHRLVGAVRKSGVRRYLVVGGAGSLEVSPGVMLIDTPSFPEAFKAEAAKGSQFLDYLKAVDDLDWTFLSPSALFVPGEKTGKFRIGSNTLLSSSDGSKISFEDYAIALVDELENPKHVKQRFTVGY